MKPSIKPWLFNGEPFELNDPTLEGFVYVIIDTTNRKRYIGKKFFWNRRKDPKTGRRVKKESDWKQYYGSNAYLKGLVKEKGKDVFERHILTLHKLKRDVNYMEIKMQYALEVLEIVDTADEELLYMNGNINGKHWAHLVKGIDERTKYSSFLHQL